MKAGDCFSESALCSSFKSRAQERKDSDANSASHRSTPYVSPGKISREEESPDVSKPISRGVAIISKEWGGGGGGGGAQKYSFLSISYKDVLIRVLLFTYFTLYLVYVVCRVHGTQ